MKISALCKTFRGEEWIKAMTMAIYPYMDKIVFVNSEKSWSGRSGNTCKPEIDDMKLNSDPNNKIISLNCDTIDQFAQCMHGYRWIQNNLKSDYVMLIDTDEIWDDHDLKVALDFIKNRHPGCESYRNSIFTYIKSPLYQVNPIEPLKPVTFVRGDLDNLGKEPRCCDLPYKLIIDEGIKEGDNAVYYHHYVYVRKKFNTVLEKIISSHVSEGYEYQDMSVWIEEVWKEIPKLSGHWKEGFHPCLGFKKNWLGIYEIKRADMPRVLRNNNFPILEQYGVVN
jgi:hypothetical protein